MDTLKMLVDEMIVMTRPRLKNDQRIEPELVMAFMVTARNEVIKDVYTKRVVMDGFFQRVRVRIIRDDLRVRLAVDGMPTLYSEYPVSDPFFLLPVPSVMSSLGYSAIKHLGGINFMNPFSRVSMQELPLDDLSVWTENLPKYAVDIDRIYLSKIPLGVIVAEAVAVFQDPTKLPDYNYETSLFPMPLDFKEKMMYIVKGKLYEHFSLPIDPLNDGLDTTQVRPQRQQQENE